MLLAYLLLVVACTVLTARLVRHRSRAAFVGGMATILAAISIPTGFTLGLYLAALAAVLAIVAGSRVDSSKRVT